MPTDFSDRVQQHPANIVAPNGFVGTHKLFFTGATGLVGSGYGMGRLVTATRVSTGIYRVQHPPIKGLDIFAGIAMPSGAPSYKVDQITDGLGPTGGTNSLSGTTEFHIKQPGGGASGSVAPSGAGYVLANPVSGTILRLSFFAAPLAVPPGQF